MQHCVGFYIYTNNKDDTIDVRLYRPEPFTREIIRMLSPDNTSRVLSFLSDYLQQHPICLRPTRIQWEENNDEEIPPLEFVLELRSLRSMRCFSLISWQYGLETILRDWFRIGPHEVLIAGKNSSIAAIKREAIERLQAKLSNLGVLTRITVDKGVAARSLCGHILKCVPSWRGHVLRERLSQEHLEQAFNTWSPGGLLMQLKDRNTLPASLQEGESIIQYLPTKVVKKIRTLFLSLAT